MLIVTDSGGEMVNAEAVFCFSVVNTPAEGHVLIAHGAAGNIRTALCAGSENRCLEALEKIRKGTKERRHVLDLRDEIGPRSTLNIATPSIVLPGNGQPRP